VDDTVSTSLAVVTIAGSLASVIGLWAVIGEAMRRRNMLRWMDARIRLLSGKLHSLEDDAPIELRELVAADLEDMRLMRMLLLGTEGAWDEQAIWDRGLYWRTEQATRSRRRRRWRRRDLVRSLKVSVPGWMFLLFTADDAERYGREWDNHMWQLVEEDRYEEARHHRRSLVLRTVPFAIALRLRRMLQRAGMRR
jgi:hypothetical protein